MIQINSKGKKEYGHMLLLSKIGRCNGYLSFVFFLLFIIHHRINNRDIFIVLHNLDTNNIGLCIRVPKYFFFLLLLSLQCIYQHSKGFLFVLGQLSHVLTILDTLYNIISNTTKARFARLHICLLCLKSEIPYYPIAIV